MSLPIQEFPALGGKYALLEYLDAFLHPTLEDGLNAHMGLTAYDYLITNLAQQTYNAFADPEMGAQIPNHPDTVQQLRQNFLNVVGLGLCQFMTGLLQAFKNIQVVLRLDGLFLNQHSQIYKLFQVGGLDYFENIYNLLDLHVL